MWFWLRAVPWFLQWPGSARNQGRRHSLPGHHLVQVGWTVGPGWGSLFAVSRLRCRLPGTRLREPLGWAMTLPGTTRSACRVSGVSHTELGVPQGKVSGDWLLPLYTGALSLRQVAPSRVGGWNSAAMNLSETGCTFPFKTNPEATLPVRDVPSVANTWDCLQLQLRRQLRRKHPCAPNMHEVSVSYPNEACRSLFLMS